MYVCISYQPILIILQPYHPGHMAQIGLNMGPRDARILGWAKSFTKNLSRTERIAEDQDLIGALSLLWALVNARMPSDITEAVNQRLDEQMPRLASRDIPPGVQLNADNWFF
jgi:hypothetical protein